MSHSDRSTAGRDQLALDGLLTDDERRPLSVQGHHQFRESLSESRPFDEIDMECDDMTLIDPYEVHGPSRKSDAELNRFLSILDNLENGKEITR